MKGSNYIREFIKLKEGFRSKPYLCSAGVPTIGYGSTMYPNGKKVTLKDKSITKEYATEIFDWHLSLFERDVNVLLIKGLNPNLNGETRLCGVDDLSKVNHIVSQNRFDALLDFSYNIGTDIDSDDIAEGLGDSTLFKKILKDSNDITIRSEFMKWNKERKNGKLVPNKGLTERRAQDADLYFNPNKPVL